MTSSDSSYPLLAEGGLLAQKIPTFRARAAQQRMAAAVSEALKSPQTWLIEAGTGTGKTYAYLLPALMSGRKVLISTGTKNLQDQLYLRDLPKVIHALGLSVKVSLLKGRSNYVCLHRLDQQASDSRIERLRQWVLTTSHGEIGHAPVSVDAALGHKVTSTADNCLGSKCGLLNDCFVAKARRAAVQSDIVIVNHHLLLADFRLKDEGFGEILPSVEAVIVDEAHQLPDLASQFFGVRVSTRQIEHWLADTQSEIDRLRDLPTELDAAVQSVLAASQSLPRTLGRQDWPPSLDLAALIDPISALHTALKVWESRSLDLAALVSRGADYLTRLQRLITPRADDIRWLEGQTGGVLALNLTPLQAADDFKRIMGERSWVFTSATLADFGHFQRQLGIEKPQTLQLASPFDYPRQARLYLPTGLPDPNQPDYLEAIAALARDLVQASRGGAFLLCTSHRAVTLLAQRLRDLPEVLVQGQRPKNELLQQFAHSGHALLIATASFWEGVDVPGQALRLVIIDRIPFTPPGDPVLEARQKAIRADGGDPFNQEQLPRALMALRQGVGRLIRTETDRGLLVLADPRLQHKAYGRQLLSGLPPMPRLHELHAARQWLQSLST